MVFVHKKSGDLRLCIDYRELNKRTVKNAYHLPRPEEAQDHLARSAVFSSLDLWIGYWQLPIHEEDRLKNSFLNRPRTWTIPVLPNALSIRCTIINPASHGQGLSWTPICYNLPRQCADTLPMTRNMRSTFEKCFSVSPKLGSHFKGRNAASACPKLHSTYLGHVFSSEGMKPDPQKISAVKEWTMPTDVSSLCSFLGLASYYRRYIQGFADIAALLHHLTSKGVAFHWDTTFQSAFEQFKVEFTKIPVLSFPDFSQAAATFHLQRDGSAIGIGAVLEQNGHVIAYASHVLSSPERNYSVIQRECLAVVYALKHFRHYLLGRHFILLTDQAPLLWLSAQKMEGMLARWPLAMQEYSFTAQHWKGKDNGNADALSCQSQPERDGTVSLCLLPTGRTFDSTSRMTLSYR